MKTEKIINLRENGQTIGQHVANTWPVFDKIQYILANLVFDEKYQAFGR